MQAFLLHSKALLEHPCDYPQPLFPSYRIHSFHRHSSASPARAYENDTESSILTHLVFREVDHLPFRVVVSSSNWILQTDVMHVTARGVTLISVCVDHDMSIVRDKSECIDYPQLTSVYLSLMPERLFFDRMRRTLEIGLIQLHPQKGAFSYTLDRCTRMHEQFRK